VLELRALAPQIADVLLGHLAHVGVGEQLLGAREAGLDLNVVMERRGQRGDLGVLAREGEEAALVLGDLRITEHRAELVVTIGDAVELGAERGFHVRGATRGERRGKLTPRARPRNGGRRALPRAPSPG
jgi:hypothetical protein